METATFAGGCFWALEEVFRQAHGVVQTEVGYMGGHVPSPTHAQVRSGSTGHAEVVNISFDPGLVSYDDLLKLFFSSHDPTQLNRQGPDIGPEFRSAIFYHSAEQCQAANSARAVFRQMKRSPHPVMTELVPASVFYPAAEIHQHFLAKEQARNRPWYPPVAEALACAGGPRNIRTK
jgi:peptide-methionine (S)-S-oxide reductase